MRSPALKRGADNSGFQLKEYYPIAQCLKSAIGNTLKVPLFEPFANRHANFEVLCFFFQFV
jgi:hypothetical protein